MLPAEVLPAVTTGMFMTFRANSDQRHWCGSCSNVVRPRKPWTKDLMVDYGEDGVESDEEWEVRARPCIAMSCHQEESAESNLANPGSGAGVGTGASGGGALQHLESCTPHSPTSSTHACGRVIFIFIFVLSSRLVAPHRT